MKKQCFLIININYFILPIFIKVFIKFHYIIDFAYNFINPINVIALPSFSKKHLFILTLNKNY
jgi:hypothetical protein